jgi:hypothetical protein
MTKITLVYFVAFFLRKYLSKAVGKKKVDSQDIGRRLCKNPAYVNLIK